MQCLGEFERGRLGFPQVQRDGTGFALSSGTVQVFTRSPEGEFKPGPSASYFGAAPNNGRWVSPTEFVFAANSNYWLGRLEGGALTLHHRILPQSTVRS